MPVANLCKNVSSADTLRQHVYLGGGLGDAQPRDLDDKVPQATALNAKGLTNVQDLLLRYALHGKSSLGFEDYLKTAAGVKPHYAAQIIAGLEAQDASARLAKPRVTLSIEGNIGCGKSTFLSLLRGPSPDEGLQDVQLVPEPVHEWQNVRRAHRPDRLNILEMFYRDPQRMAYTFQNFVFLTRVCQERSSWSSTRDARVIERSVFSDRMVFVRAVRRMGQLSEDELDVYDHWYRPMLESLPTLIPNGFIYIRATPETCLQRLQTRNRSEEVGIGLDYLQALHENHEDWLASGMPLAEAEQLSLKLHQQQQQQQGGQGRLVSGDRKADRHPERRREASSLSAPDECSSNPKASPGQNPPGFWGWEAPLVKPLDLDPPRDLHLVEVPRSIRHMVKFIDATKSKNIMLRHLHQAPALVLDCDGHVDVLSDPAYGILMRKYVQDFITFLQSYSRVRYRRGQGPGQLVLPEGLRDYYTVDRHSGDLSYRDTLEMAAQNGPASDGSTPILNWVLRPEMMTSAPSEGTTT